MCHFQGDLRVILSKVCKATAGSLSQIYKYLLGERGWLDTQWLWTMLLLKGNNVKQSLAWAWDKEYFKHKNIFLFLTLFKMYIEA